MSAYRERRPFDAALQALGIGALLLPVVGVFIRMIQYATVPAMPRGIIFSESVGDLSYSGAYAVVVPSIMLALLWFMSVSGLMSLAVGGELNKTPSRNQVLLASGVLGTAWGSETRT